MRNLNSDEPWSEIDDRDLRWWFEHRQPLAAIAEFLGREVEDIEERLQQLGLRPTGAIH